MLDKVLCDVVLLQGNCLVVESTLTGEVLCLLLMLLYMACCSQSRHFAKAMQPNGLYLHCACLCADKVL